MGRPNHCSYPSRVGPDEGTEWHLEECVNPIVVDGVEIGLCACGVELFPPLSVCADEIAMKVFRVFLKLKSLPPLQIAEILITVLTVP
jgi:hypothetical protein